MNELKQDYEEDDDSDARIEDQIRETILWSTSHALDLVDCLHDPSKRREMKRLIREYES